MKNLNYRVLLALAGTVTQLFADDFPETVLPVGRVGRSLVTPANQIVTPAGTLINLPGMRPLALALSPNGKILVTAGLTHELAALDPATGEVIQHVEFPSDQAKEPEAITERILSPDGQAQLSFTGLAFSPDGARIYLANVNGDIKVFKVSRDNSISPLFSMALPPTQIPTRNEEIPTGLAVSADGKKLYVAGNLSNRLLELDTATGKTLRQWNVGMAPFNVVLCRNKAYVSNWAGRRPDPNSRTGPAGEGSHVRVDARGIASEGSVTMIDLGADAGTGSGELLTGLHACALALSPDKKFLVAANAGSDSLSVIDTRNDQVIETVCARLNPGDLFGAQPNALAFDRSGGKLFVCNGTQNAVAVFQFKPGATKLLGLLPVGWFPGAIVVDGRRDQLCVANLKDIATQPQKGRRGATGRGYNTHQYCGTLSLVAIPTQAKLTEFTKQALTNLRYPLLAQAKLPPRPGRTPVPVPERAGEPSVFKHVIYIIKENRSYDQVLGDVKEGNGAADLCIFGERVTPNQHQLVREFALLDNTYCCGILSADGHNWADSGIATDYVEREFAGWPRSYPAGGGGERTSDALAFSPAGFLWDNALAHGQTVANFGEFTTGHKRWKNPARKQKIGFSECWRDFTTGANEIEYTCEPDIAAVGSFMVPGYNGWDLSVPDGWRAAFFNNKLKEYAERDNLPALTVLGLPNDHTSGTDAGKPTPAAMVADNDLAFGQIVEALSRSKYWADTCLIAVEDDPQNGWDHVSGYRTTAYVISAFTKRHAVVSTQYNQTSLLRTIELMLGLPPMNQMDATATPLFNCFTNVPDFTVFTAVTNRVPLDKMNPAPKQIADAQLRRDACVSAQLPLDQPDQCPEEVLNHILWRATMGAKPYPQWAVTKTDED